MAVTKTCERCGKEFSVSPGRKDTAKFCSRECHQPTVLARCTICHKEFRSSPSHGDRKYCSQDCYWKSMKGVRPTYQNCRQPNQIEHSCGYCGKTFTLSPAKSNRGNRSFCSFECMGLANRDEPGKPYTKDDLERMYVRERMSFDQIADVLDSTKWVIKRILKANKIAFRDRKEWAEAAWKHADEKRFDTARANGKKNIRKLIDVPKSVRQKRSVAAAAALQNKKGPTSIESKMMQALDRESIGYIFQFPVGSKFLCDFKLSDHDIIIECDGIYWHSTPKAKIRDKGKNAYLRKCGYEVLRFTDKQINGDIDECITVIKEYIANHRIADSIA